MSDHHHHHQRGGKPIPAAGFGGVSGIEPFFPRDRRNTYGTARKLVNGVLPKCCKMDLPATP